MTRYCPNCGAPVEDDVCFCTRCGAFVPEEGTDAPLCPYCGDVIEPGSSFCPTCGMPLDPEATTPMPDYAAGTPADPTMAQQSPLPAYSPAGTSQPGAAYAAPGKKSAKNVLPYVAGAAAALVVVAIVLLVSGNLFGSKQMDSGNSDATVATQITSQEGSNATAVNSGSTASSTADAEPQKDEELAAPAELAVDHNKGVNAASESDDYYVLPESSSRVYSASELAGLSAWDLKVARNEIFARYGRCFNTPELQNYFESKSWYRGLYDPEEFDAMSSPLSDVERANVDVIKSLEAESNFK